MQAWLTENDRKVLEWLAKRIPRLIAAWIVGCFICLANSFYDGMLALVFLPFFTAFNAAVAVTLSLLLGVIILNRSIRRFWNSTYLPAIALFTVSGLLLSFGLHLGLGQEWIDPDSGVHLIVLHPGVLFGGLLAMVFAVAHWPAPTDHASPNVVDLVVTSLTEGNPTAR